MPGVSAGAERLANASESFLLAAVSVAFDVVSTKFAVESCWRTVVSLAAASARSSTARLERVGQSERREVVHHPRCLELALAFDVGETESNLPRSPGTVDGREAFPIIYLA